MTDEQSKSNPIKQRIANIALVVENYDDAIEFCQKLGNKKLCPYPACEYMPYNNIL